MLGREIATALRGRTLTYEVFPFSFQEFLDSKNIKFETKTLFSKSRHHIRKLFENYLFSGGYPEIAAVEDKLTQTRILQDYFNTIFYRDLVERYKIKNRDLMRLWLSTLMANVSSMISLSKVESDFKSRGMKLSRASLSTYAGYVEDVYFGFFVSLFTESVRKRQVNPKKFYLIDQGLHNLLTLKFQENKGRLLENLVFLELRRKGKYVSYFKSKSKRGYEIDFLVDEQGKKKIIQVCHDLSHIDTFNRERRAIQEGIKELGLDSGLILTTDEHRQEKIGSHTINIMPVWEWLLVNT
jgi:predicted AAA+ superfamily ATPase